MWLLTFAKIVMKICQKELIHKYKSLLLLVYFNLNAIFKLIGVGLDHRILILRQFGNLEK